MQIRNLQRLSYAMGFTHWLYVAEDFVPCLGPGYFDDASGMMEAGSMLTISSPDNVSVRCILKPHADKVVLAHLS